MRLFHLPAVVLSLLTFTLAGAVPSRADEATSSQLNEAHTGASLTGAMSPALTKAWTVDLGSETFSPVMAGGKIFVETAGKSVGSPGPGQLTALDSQTGHVIWGPINLAAPVATGAAPAYENGRLFTVTPSGMLQAFDAQTGLPLWSRALPGAYYGYYQPPVAHGGGLYLVGGSQAYGIDEVTGSVRWTLNFSYSASTTPTVSDDGVYLGFNNSVAYKLDPATGSVLWSYLGSYFNGGAEPTVLYKNRLYLPGSSYGNLILDGATGRPLDTYAASLNSPAFAQNDGYFINQGNLERRDLLTGDTAWTYGDGTLTGSPIYLNGYLYLASSAGALFGVDAANGQQVWTADLSASVPNGSSYVPVGFAAAGGKLVVPVGNTLAAFSYTVVPVPLISGTATGDVSGRSIAVTASINPNGSAATAHLEYGPGTDYGSSTPNQALGSGTAVTSFSDTIPSLTPGQTYHYRVVASNPSGTANGPDQSVQTGSELAPTAQTALPSASSSSSATVNGQVNPNGLATQAYFDFGQDTTYGRQSPAQSFPGLNQWLPLTAIFTNLLPNTTYHYRVTAMNSSGTFSSGDQAFLTPPPQPPTAVATTLSETTAGVVLNGTVNPNGSATTYHFEYWHYYETHSRTPDVSAGSGNSPVTVSANLPTEVSSGTLNFEVVATNATDTTTSDIVNGNVIGKAYVPSATTGDATPSNLSAVVSGTVTSLQYVTVTFDYGLDTTYGQTSGVALYGTPYYTNEFVSVTLNGLVPSTTYHYRTVVSTGYHTVYGVDATFTTGLHSTALEAFDDAAFVSNHKPVTLSPTDNDIVGNSGYPQISRVGQGVFGSVKLNSDNTVTYTPGKSFTGIDIFTYMIGDPLGENATANVVIRSLEASLAGRYTCALGGAGLQFDEVGQITVSLTALGSFTGSVRLGSYTWPIHGKLTDGAFSGTFKVPKQPSVDIAFSLDVTTGLLDGSVNQAGDEQFYEASRAVYSNTIATPQKGRYTLDLAQSGQPFYVGHGFATINITAAGAVTVVGRMCDGQALSSSSFISADGTFPFYALLNKATKQSLAGLLTVEPGYYSDLDGHLWWITPGAAGNAINGVSFQVDAIGSVYVPPAKGEGLIPVDLSVQGNTVLQAQIDDYSYYLIELSLTKKNTFVQVDPHSGCVVKVNTATGLLSGTLTDQASHPKFTLGGVVLQAQTSFTGYYRDSTGVQGLLQIFAN